MGADLILGYLWTTDPDGIDFDKAESAIEALRVEDLNDSEAFEYVEDESVFLSESVRPKVREAVAEIRDAWAETYLPRDAAKETLGPVTALITGGMSWGDDPTETWTTIQLVPWPVWQAIGFGK